MKNVYVRDFGAAGDGVTMDTKAIQAAIDEAGKNGGGKVIFENGRFLCGRIDLRSGVELHIEADAVLLGSTDGNDFPNIETDFWRTEYAPRFNKRCMIYAEGCENIAITGRGKIDCQGDQYMERWPDNAGKQWPYRRKPHPTDAPDGMVHYPDIPFPLNPYSVSLSPGRVVLFMGCKNVYVEDITLANSPAGWGYWVCDCDNVHFHRAQILAEVRFPNNDGIHINCSRNVTVSDCNITCGDDGIVIRAYSLPLHENKVCEKVTVTNCNITSHSGGIRIGWYGDGVMRNCTFSNINFTDTCVGIDILLPENPKEHRGSDQGEEETLIENLSFSNLTMDRVFFEPVRIEIGSDCLCNAIRNLYFDNIHAFAAHMPMIIGRKGNMVENIHFTDCQFNQIDRSTIPDESEGPRMAGSYTIPDQNCVPRGRAVSMLPYFTYVKNLCMNNTVFNSAD